MPSLLYAVLYHRIYSLGVIYTVPNLFYFPLCLRNVTSHDEIETGWQAMALIKCWIEMVVIFFSDKEN